MDLDKKKIVVAGAGAMGLVFGGVLGKAGHEVVFLEKDGRRAEALSQQGVVIDEGQERERLPARATADPREAGPADYLFICVKSPDTRAAAEKALLAAGPLTQAVSVQNGLGNMETLAEIFGADRVIGGSTAQGATFVATGHVRRAGTGETVLGELGGGTARAEVLAGVLTPAGLSARVTTDLTGLIWSKLVINAAINPLTALLKVRNGALAESEPARQTMALVVAEVQAVCQKKGITLLHPDPLARVLEVARATSGNLSSMLQDARARRRTEIEFINGAVAREAAALGLDAPMNRALTNLIQCMESAYDKAIS